MLALSDISPEARKPPRGAGARRGFGSLWRLGGLPVILWLSLQALASAQFDPAEGAETAFLGLMAAGAVACMGALAPRRPIAEIAAGLAVAVLWCVHDSGGRGSLLTLILTLGLLTAARGAAVSLGEAAAKDRGEGDVFGRKALEHAGFFVPACLGWQLVVRPDLLLPPWLDARTLVSVLPLPILAGLALALLAERRGLEGARLAGLVAAVLAPGWNVTTTLGLLALAALGWILPARRHSPPDQGTVLTVAAAVLCGGLLVAVAFEGGGAALALPLVLTLCLIPTLFRVRVDGSWLAGLALMAGGSALRPDPETLVLGAGWLALEIARGASAERVRLQRAWGTLAACAVALAAGYPRLLPDPILAPPPRSAAFLLLGSAAAVWLLDLLARRLDQPASRLLGPALLATAIAAAPAAPLAVFDQPRTLGPWGHTLVFDLPAPSVERGASAPAALLDTSLVHGVELPRGAPVARVEWLDAAGEVLESRSILAGEHTAEWAAGRADVAARPGFHSPPPRAFSLAPDGRFFAQHFRTRLEVGATAAPAARLRIVRDPALPEATRVLLHRLEIRP
ncbi:MAG: hypothetical protein AAF725_00030 [Acidobacteriota bacterium]